MDAGVTSFRSILDKPLSQLTEEDISQLTREDCRKYLKEKGMRRPSWNKSQAIQQVISLKALLETDDDSGAGALRKILDSKPPATPNSIDSVKEASGDANNNTVSLSPEDTFPSRQNDSPKSNPQGPLDCQLEETDDKAVAPTRNACVGQMTIFYCGKVNVYDGVLPDKARAIMHLAANSIQLPLDDPICGSAAFTFPCHLQTVNDKHGIVPTSAPVFQTTHTDIEGQSNRKVSLQRYLEKRKDRGRLKGRKSAGPMPSGLEAYVNHHVRAHTSNGQVDRDTTGCLPQLGMLHAFCSSADNQSKTTTFSVDLNEDVEER